jgi:hypothetical protein
VIRSAWQDRVISLRKRRMGRTLKCGAANRRNKNCENTKYKQLMNKKDIVLTFSLFYSPFSRGFPVAC